MSIRVKGCILLQEYCLISSRWVKYSLNRGHVISSVSIHIHHTFMYAYRSTSTILLKWVSLSSFLHQCQNVFHLVNIHPCTFWCDRFWIDNFCKVELRKIRQFRIPNHPTFWNTWEYSKHTSQGSALWRHQTIWRKWSNLGGIHALIYCIDIGWYVDKYVSGSLLVVLL